MPSGGGTCFPVVRNIFPTNPRGVQFAIAIIPPDFVTRNNSRATKSGRGANIAPKVEITTSKAPPTSSGGRKHCHVNTECASNQVCMPDGLCYLLAEVQ